MADPTLTAYRLAGPELPLKPASPNREWMERTEGRNALRCLPLLIANQAGWMVLNTHRVVVVWRGGNSAADLHVVYHPTSPDYIAGRTLFGHGILTWTIPYLFRTPPGYNLLVRGPANWPKDGASPLEGVVETDWTEASFTMNWQITRPKQPVIFEVDEPICMLVPQRRGELETFRPRIRELASEPELERGWNTWQQSRERFKSEKAQPGSDAAERGYQLDYVRGTTPVGGKAREHQTRINLRPFVQEPEILDA